MLCYYAMCRVSLFQVGTPAVFPGVVGSVMCHLDRMYRSLNIYVLHLGSFSPVRLFVGVFRAERSVAGRDTSNACLVGFWGSW